MCLCNNDLIHAVTSMVMGLVSVISCGGTPSPTPMIPPLMPTDSVCHCGGLLMKPTPTR